MAIYEGIQSLIRDYAVGVIYLFSHDARNFASRIVLAREALIIERATLLMRELETHVLLIDRRTDRTSRVTTSASGTGSEHEAGSQLGTTCGSQNRSLSESSKSRGSEALGKGTTGVILLLAETSIALDVAFFVEREMILGVFHHDAQVRSEV